MTRQIIWARTDKSKKVHLFIDGKRQCLTGYHGDPYPIFDTFPNWNPDDKLTCPRCKERHFWLTKGAIPVNSGLLEPTKTT